MAELVGMEPTTMTAKKCGLLYFFHVISFEMGIVKRTAIFAMNTRISNWEIGIFSYGNTGVKEVIKRRTFSIQGHWRGNVESTRGTAQTWEQLKKLPMEMEGKLSRSNI